MSTRTRKRRKLKADINVVPYIDVMLVLLIIFMVTAPLLTLGVDVDLPQSNAKPLEQKKDSVTAVITKDGHYLLTLSGGKYEAIEPADLARKVGAFHDQNPDVPVYIGADGKVDYQHVISLMDLLAKAGVPKVALISLPEQTGPAAKRH